MSKKAKKSSSPSSKQKKQPGRNFYVFTALAGALTMTGALLVALSPQPLRPDGSAAMAAAVEGADSINTVYSTPSQVTPGRWKYVYVHHSRSTVGSAQALALSPTGTTDHFVITNGNGGADGDLQLTPLWSDQRPATSPTGSGTIDPACISVCLIGDFDQAAPTPAQHHRLTQLINSLQSQLHLSAHCVIMLDQPATQASVGRHFPTGDFRTQLLR